MKFMLAGIALAALTLIPAAGAFASDRATVDSPAPGFTLADQSGKTHSLSDFAGKIVVLEWVNYDCPFVRKHYGSGNMQALQRKYTEKGAVWLSICSSAPGKQGYFEGKDLLSRIAAEKAVPSAYLVDADGTVGQAYGAKTTPHMYVIDTKGILVYAGGIDDIASTDQKDIGKAKNYVSDALEATLGGKPVATKGSKPYGCSVKYK